MKKITKKAYSQAPEFIVKIDYCIGKAPFARYSDGAQLIVLEAGDLLSAMAEAEEYHSDSVYILTISKKFGMDDSHIRYKNALVARSKGNWRIADHDHGEDDRFGVEITPDQLFDPRCWDDYRAVDVRAWTFNTRLDSAL